MDMSFSTNRLSEGPYQRLRDSFSKADSNRQNDHVDTQDRDVKCAEREFHPYMIPKKIAAPEKRGAQYHPEEDAPSAIHSVWFSILLKNFDFDTNMATATILMGASNNKRKYDLRVNYMPIEPILRRGEPRLIFDAQIPFKEREVFSTFPYVIYEYATSIELTSQIVERPREDVQMTTTSSSTSTNSVPKRDSASYLLKFCLDHATNFSTNEALQRSIIETLVSDGVKVSLEECTSTVTSRLKYTSRPSLSIPKNCPLPYVVDFKENFMEPFIKNSLLISLETEKVDGESKYCPRIRIRLLKQNKWYIPLVRFVTPVGGMTLGSILCRLVFNDADNFYTAVLAIVMTLTITYRDIVRETDTGELLLFNFALMLFFLSLISSGKTDGAIRDTALEYLFSFAPLLTNFIFIFNWKIRDAWVERMCEFGHDEHIRNCKMTVNENGEKILDENYVMCRDEITKMKIEDLNLQELSSVFTTSPNLMDIPDDILHINNGEWEDFKPALQNMGFFNDEKHSTKKKRQNPTKKRVPHQQSGLKGQGQNDYV